MNSRDAIALDNVLFYHIERAIRTYRQFAQKELKRQGINVTIDQWLLMKTLEDHPGLMQHELADLIFKEEASVTRMVSLLIRNSYLIRRKHIDKRRSILAISAKGKQLLRKVKPVILENRKKALTGVTIAAAARAEKVLMIITKNCS